MTISMTNYDSFEAFSEAFKEAMDKTVVLYVTLPNGIESTVRKYTDYANFYDIEGIDIPWACGSDIEKIADMLWNYELQLKKLDDERAELAQYRASIDAEPDAEKRQSMWNWYSDWHKDLYGYRPR